MAFLGIGKKRTKTVDFTKLESAQKIMERSPREYPASDEIVELRNSNSNFSGNNNSSPLSFLDSSQKSSSSTTSLGSLGAANVVSQVSEMSELKSKMRSITTRMEDTLNELYRMMQRIELLEKKLERFENRGF
ncbi:hypothetical protein J4463_03630 [Candidatus Pacearchaeota archaeon]|nr:hypothetical protein [Candidatus Pacearchaeota archaeon]